MAIHIWNYLLLGLCPFYAVLKEINAIRMYVVHRTLLSGERIASRLQAKITRSGPTGKLRVVCLTDPAE
jgi:hypothetical protein